LVDAKFIDPTRHRHENYYPTHDRPFLVFLMYIGAVQFLHAGLTGGYPFNSLLAGFAAAVGQFVLTSISSLLRLLRMCADFAVANLRSQTDKANRGKFPEVSSERYCMRSFVVVGRLLFVVTFME
jgi:hypothetical protein